MRKYIRNGRKKKGRPPCEAILGDTHKLGKFAHFWGESGDDLMLVAAVKLHEYEMQETFDKKDIEAFKKGLASIGVFFAACAVEIENLKAKEGQEMEKVG